MGPSPERRETGIFDAMRERDPGRRGKVTLALCFLMLSAAPAGAVSLGTIPVPPDTREVSAVLERGRKATVARDFAEAGKAFDGAFQMPAFLQLPKPDQLNAFWNAALAADGRQDHLAAHEFIVIATGYPDASGDHWVMRAQTASWVDAWADAALSIGTVAREYPAELPEIGHETIQWVALNMDRDKKLAGDRLEML